MKVLFSPKGGCALAITAEIKLAKSQILILAYGFNSATIASALMEAWKDRTIDVQLVVDRCNWNPKLSKADDLATFGIPVYVDDKHQIAHNKVIIIDNEIVITGSYNFTDSAEYRNAENLLIIQNKDLATMYKTEWNKHRMHSVKYEGPDEVRASSIQPEDIIDIELEMM
jgi:phosphatidylserine/phosphatidylglycerophosphate/cardiolipin synthase-like enzyme